MSNVYYIETFSAALGSQARSAALEAQFKAIEAAFDLINTNFTNVVAKGSSVQTIDGLPASLVGQAGKVLVVTNGEGGYTLVSQGNLTIKTLGGTSYTLIPGDAGKQLNTTNGAAVAVTITSEAQQIVDNAGLTFVTGDILCLNQKGAGQVTFVPGSGVTIRSSDNLLKTRTQYAQVALEYQGSNEWLLIGERNAPTLGFATLVGGNALTGTQSVAFQALTDAASIVIDASLSNNFSVTLAGNRTLAAPTNLKDGADYTFHVKQDATGSRTLAYNALFKFAAGTAPTLTTTANALDVLVFTYSATLGILVNKLVIKDVR